jgi:phosphate transport system permease protein
MSTAVANPYSAKPTAVRSWEKFFFWVFRGATYFVLLCGAAVFGHIVFKGSQTVFRLTPPFVNVPFLTQAPETLYVFEQDGKKVEMGDKEYRTFRESAEAKAKAAGEPAPVFKAESYAYSAGGIFPCIVGTVLLVVGSMAIALVLGVASAIFLTEYATQGPIVRAIRLAILNLAGVPSIVFGLFGFGMFVIFFGWNVSLLAGWFTLAFMVLPVIITASEEALKTVPKGFREGSLALGATKWQTIRKSVLPYALPGILTSSILGIARVAGETAPIMFTAAYVVRDKLPWEVTKFSDFFFQGVMALPYHIYVVSSKIPQNEYTERVQYGTAFVFLLIVALIAAASIVLRNKLRSRYKW